MKLGVGLLNVPTVANSGENTVNPWLVGMVDPAYGAQLAEISGSSALSWAGGDGHEGGPQAI